MNRFLTLFTLTIFYISFASAQVNYDITADKNNVEINTTAVLSCDETSSNCPVNSWNLQWTIPENTEITKISDTQGPIQNYQRTSNNLIIQTNNGPRRTREKIQINIIDRSQAEQITKGLYRHSISLSGVENKETTGKINVDKLLSFTTSTKFNSTQQNNSLLFEGQGAGNTIINFGKGNRSTYYTFFGGERNGTLPYKIAVGTTGITQNYNTIPVAIMNDTKYSENISEWSEGEYSASTIKIRNLSEKDFQPVLAEETVHAFNDKAFNFQNTSSTWLDEGIGSYTQAMVRKKLLGSEKTRNLFGENTVYTEERNGSTYRITKPSNGNREALWNYYQDNRSFMKNWNPRETSSQVRKFGYAYSELIIRNHVSKGNKISQLYPKISQIQSVNSNKEKWSHMKKHLDLTPCKFEKRQKFDKCLKKINSYNYKIYSAEEIPQSKSETIQINKLETPNYTQENRSQILWNNQTLEIKNTISTWFQNTVNAIYNWLFSKN